MQASSLADADQVATEFRDSPEVAELVEAAQALHALLSAELERLTGPVEAAYRRLYIARERIEDAAAVRKGGHRFADTVADLFEDAAVPRSESHAVHSALVALVSGESVDE